MSAQGMNWGGDEGEGTYLWDRFLQASYAQGVGWLDALSWMLSP